MQKRRRKSGRSSYHELDTVADEIYQYYLSVRNEKSAKNHTTHSRNPLGVRMRTLVRLSTLLGIPRYRLLTAFAHPRV